MTKFNKQEQDASDAYLEAQGQAYIDGKSFVEGHNDGEKAVAAISAKQSAKNEILESFNGSMLELLALRRSLQNVILGQGWIVRTGGEFALSFTINGSSASNPQVSSLNKATRFSERDAKAVAALVQNGNGEVGEAVHINTAVEESIQNLAKLIAQVGSA